MVFGDVSRMLLDVVSDLVYNIFCIGQTLRRLRVSGPSHSEVCLRCCSDDNVAQGLATALATRSQLIFWRVLRNVGP